MWHERRRTGRCALFAASLLTLSTPTASARAIAVFPGSVRSVPAPDGSGARIFYRPHISSDRSQASPVFYDDGRGHVQQLATVYRNMGLRWSTDGRRAFLQDNWGSNIADCYALTRTSTSISGFSLSRLVQRMPGRPPAEEREGHYYVQCDDWLSPEVIVGSIRGHTDASPSRGFNHPFTYNTRSRRIIWGHKPPL